jgi:amino acid transporter
MKPDIHRPTLRRGIDRAGFFALAFGSMIGVGWVTALGTWLEQAGPLGAILGFAAGGALMICIGLCYAELCAMLPVTGGEVAYAYLAFGTAKAYVVGWFLAFGYLAVSAFEAVSVGRVVGFLFPVMDRWPLYTVGEGIVYAPHLLLAVASTFAITWVNLRGGRAASHLQTFLTFVFLSVTAVFVVTGLVIGEVHNAAPLFAHPEWRGAAAGCLAIFATAPFWFVGFDTIPQGAEEANATVPARTLARMLLLSILGATGFYCVLIWSVALVGPWKDLIGSDLPAAEAFRQAMGSAWLANLVLVAALLGLLTSWNGFFLAGSRVLFALGRGRMAPSQLERMNDATGSPTGAVLISGAVTVIGACLGRGAIVAFIDVGSFCIALAFLGVALSTARLRRDQPELPRPFRMPAPAIVPWLAGIGALFILLMMAWPASPAALVWPLEWVLLLGVAGLGALGWWLGAPRRRATTTSMRSRLVLGEFASRRRTDT